jgi:DNA polymerase I-like protein with 3'-5' exonuclease and polymerase domains
MWLGNNIVAAGWKIDDEIADTTYLKEGLSPEYLISLCETATLVIGHNIKFDLLYLYRYTSNKLPRIWCTQLAAYILSGQRQMYASLDELTMEYVGAHALKDDKIKTYWKNGVDTESIPEEELLPYLVSDVENTATIFNAQFAEAEALGILPLMFTQMDALRATTEMNRHGMQINKEYVDNQRNYYGAILENARNNVYALEPMLDTASPKQLSLYFFGGTSKEMVREDVGFYKNGKPKSKLVEHDRIYPPKYKPVGEVGKNGYYSVDDAVLHHLTDAGDAVASELLVIRDATKIKETYYEGLNTLLFPSGKIYPNLNHCVTKTGRLSSTNPNLQNQTDNGDVKRAYVSRYGKLGSMLELDYSQLEMIALAYLANDEQLIEDINAGRDMHRELYKGMYGRYPTDKERKPFKRYSFLLVYGGGATTLMAQSGCDRATATKFIKTFYTRYKGVKAYHEEIVKKANDNAVVLYDPAKSGPEYTYYHNSPTGRHYLFNKYPNEYKGDLSFSPTELKNWPIQGFATGDVVPMMVGILLRNLEDAGYAEKALLVMTVHDSVVLDVPNDMLYDVSALAQKTLESAPMYMKKYFNIDFPCKLGVGVEAGINWQDKMVYPPT